MRRTSGASAGRRERVGWRDEQCGEGREKEIREENRGDSLRREGNDDLREYREKKCPHEVRRGLRSVEHHGEYEKLVEEVALVAPGPVIGGGAVAHEPEVHECSDDEEGEVERIGFPESDRDVVNREAPEHAERGHHPAIVGGVGERFCGNVTRHERRLAVSRCGRQ